MLHPVPILLSHFHWIRGETDPLFEYGKHTQNMCQNTAFMFLIKRACCESKAVCDT